MRSRGGSFGSGQRTFFSFNAPAIIWVLVATTIVTSIVVAIGSRNGFPLGEWIYFSPERVAHGQLWRLVTWTFVEVQPLSLVFSCLMHIWFSAELYRHWGPRRFLVTYFAFVAGSAALTMVIGLVWPEVWGMAYVGGGAVADAMVIAWALLFPAREILIYFVLPLKGRGLIAVTIVGTTLYAIYYGLSLFIPHYIAEFGMLAYLGGIAHLVRRWQVSRSTKQQVAKIIQMRPRKHDDNDDGGGGTAPSGKRWLN